MANENRLLVVAKPHPIFRSMKKILTILGVIFLIVIVVGVSLIGYAAYWGTKLDASSKAYVDETVPMIISSWSREALTNRASPQLREKTSDVQIDLLFNKLSDKLGAFESYDGAKGQSNLSLTSQDGQITTAFYTAGATFQKGKANIKIKLVRGNNSWQILGFNVEVLPL